MTPRNSVEFQRVEQMPSESFLQKLFLVLVDKLLLGAILAWFGYFLSRLLEDYRSKNAYATALLEKRVEASRELAKVLTDHHEKVLGLRDAVEIIALKRAKGEEPGDKDRAPAFRYIREHKELFRRMSPLLVVLPGEIAATAIAYLKIASSVAEHVRGERETLPSEEQLLNAFSNFIGMCAFTIYTNPFDTASANRELPQTLPIDAP